MNFKIYLRSSSKAMAEKKEREDSNTEIWISGEQKKLLT